MKLPAAKGIKKVIKLFACVPIVNIAIVPRTAVNAVKKFSKMAFFVENPPCISTPKSPISCGISCRITAIVVAIPTGMLTKYAEPIIKPSIRL